jgi:phage protein U
VLFVENKNALLKLFYLNGSTEVVESNIKYKSDLKEKLMVQLRNNTQWIWVDDKAFNLNNVLNIEVHGKELKLEKLELKN